MCSSQFLEQTKGAMESCLWAGQAFVILDMSRILLWSYHSNSSIISCPSRSFSQVTSIDRDRITEGSYSDKNKIDRCYIYTREQQQQKNKMACILTLT